jgi:hypothetical protein
MNNSQINKVDDQLYIIVVSILQLPIACLETRTIIIYSKIRVYYDINISGVTMR